MNWYRFKIELMAWAWKTAVCVLMTLVYLKTLQHYDGFMMVPVEMGFLVEYKWIMPGVMWSFVATLWLCYFRAFAILRADRRYGTR